ncbi:MAG TPA: hypothetical protein VLF16_15690 [Pseudomonas sp.]|nr:hypothetical protein [Pseudomonas sp.]
MGDEVTNAPAPAAATPAAPAPAPTGAPAAPPAPAEAPAAPAPAAPVEYKFEVPDGFNANPELLTEFTELAKAEGLKPEAAQKAVGLVVKMQQQQIDQHAAMVASWEKQVKTGVDGEGKPLPDHLRFPTGDQFEPSLAIAKKALDASPPELKALLRDTGMGNHPAVLRAFYNFGKLMQPDNFVPSTPGASGTGGSDDFQSRANRMYSQPSK